MKFLGKIPLLILFGVALLVMVGMLYFGIRFKGYRPANNVTWHTSPRGLGFDRFAIAYTDSFFPESAAAGDSGLTLEVALCSTDLVHPAFRYVLTISDGDDQRQLLIGQWRHWLVVMNGNDHDGSRGTGKLYVDFDDHGSDLIFLTIATTTDGTALYLNGTRVEENPRLQLFFPHGPVAPTRLILGNSIHGSNSWEGTMAWLAIYDAGLSDTQVMENYRRWASDADSTRPDEPLPKICYRFDGTNQDTVQNLASDAYPLNIPHYMTILEKEFLAWPSIRRENQWQMSRDMLINFLGFIPLGCILSIVFYRLNIVTGRRNWLLAVGLAFAFSFFLEIVQAWIPSRDSSMLDLLLNTAGAMAGASAGWVAARRFA